MTEPRLLADVRVRFGVYPLTAGEALLVTRWNRTVLYVFHAVHGARRVALGPPT